jgi:hypothetical protein
LLLDLGPPPCFHSGRVSLPPNPHATGTARGSQTDLTQHLPSLTC